MSKQDKEKAIVVSQVAVTENQMQMLTAPTPERYIRYKPGRGGKQVKYVEGGYVTNQLNRVFGPLNWSFKIVNQGESNRKTEKNADGEVWVYGELTVHDHQRGFQVTKGQMGQHPIHMSVPIGDAYKSASTDALKKCASLFGIGLDVYWGQLDNTGETPAPKAPKPSTAGQSKKPNQKEPTVLERSKAFIQQTTDRTVLGNALQRLEITEELTVAEKHQLKKMIHEKLGITTE